MSGDTRLVRALVACYPPGWRRRYGDEYAQLLVDLRIHRRPALIADSLRGAARAHGGALMTRNSPMTTAIAAAGLFTVAGLGFAKLSEQINGHLTYAVTAVAATVALLALAAAATPAAVALLRGRDPGAWKLVAVPVVGAAAWYGVVRLTTARLAGHEGPSAAGFLVIAATGIAVVAATAWAADATLRRVAAEGPARLRPVAITTVAGGMAVATIAVSIWGLQTRGTPATGFLATPFLPSWIAIVAALAASTALAAFAARRATS